MLMICITTTCLTCLGSARLTFEQDASLKRCFGIEARIRECSWEYLSTLRTEAEPHEPMPRLKDFLQWLVQPEMQDIWVVLDIKVCCISSSSSMCHQTEANAGLPAG